MANPALCRCEGEHSASKDARSDRELRDANRRMHNFLALLGHELRSPLDAICNGLHILEQQGDEPSRREWARAMMERQTQAICRLVDGMLDVSRIEHGKIQRARKQPGGFGREQYYGLLKRSAPPSNDRAINWTSVTRPHRYSSTRILVAWSRYSRTSSTMLPSSWSQTDASG